MDWVWIVIIGIAVLLVESYRMKKTHKDENGKDELSTTKDYSQSYQAKYILTKNEYREYMALSKIAADNNLIICPKVRLLDIIEPRKGEKNYKSLFYKVQAKHVDFVICDKNLRIKAILELDDNTHNQKERQERDAFVDQILTSVGYKVIHTRAITESTLECITKSDAIEQQGKVSAENAE